MFSEICPSVLCSQTLSVTLNHWTINLTSKNFEFLLGNKNLFCGRKRFPNARNYSGSGTKGFSCLVILW